MTPFVKLDCVLGEGPLWDHENGRLFWVDIKSHKIHWHDNAGLHGTMWLGGHVTALALGEKDVLVAATYRGIEKINMKNGERALLAELENDLPQNRPNDGKLDPQGRFWIGTMDDKVQGVSGSLWRFDGTGAPRKMVGDIGIGNGLDWSPDVKTMYYTDSYAQTIWAFDFDGTDGSLSNRRIFRQVPEAEGCPDGLCVAADGTIFSAHWDGGCVSHYRPDGSIIKVIKVPVPRPTCPVLGGNAGNQLFITSASVELSDEQLLAAPESGSVFVMEVDAVAQGARRACF